MVEDLIVIRSNCRTSPAASEQMAQQRENEQHQKDEKEDLGETDRDAGDQAEAEARSYEGHDQKQYCDAEHDGILEEVRSRNRECILASQLPLPWKIILLQL
jgi:hypothetical protein